MRIKIQLKRTTCFGIGMAGALAAGIAGLLWVFAISQARYLITISLVLLGSMFLLLGVLEKGEDKKGLRTRLLFLFFALLAGNLGLPLLDAMQIVAIPGLFLLYKAPGQGRWLVLILLAEVALEVVRLLALTPLLGDNPVHVLGLVLAAVSLLRALVLRVLQKNVAGLPQQEPVKTPRLR